MKTRVYRLARRFLGLWRSCGRRRGRGRWSRRGYVEALAAAARGIDVGVVEHEFAAQSTGLKVHDGADEGHQGLAIDVDGDA